MAVPVILYAGGWTACASARVCGVRSLARQFPALQQKVYAGRGHSALICPYPSCLVSPQASGRLSFFWKEAGIGCCLARRCCMAGERNEEDKDV